MTTDQTADWMARQAEADAKADAIAHAAALDRQAREAEADREEQRRQADAAAEERRRRREESARDREHDRKLRRQYGSQTQDIARRVVLLVPLLAVNALAVTGQLGWAFENLKLSPMFGILIGWPISLVFATALESVGLFLSHHASDARRRGDASLLRQASAYGIAAVVAGINYSHWSPSWDKPTETAIVFALASGVSPWLWSLHSRARHRDELIAQGMVDRKGVKLSLNRWLWHPILCVRVQSWASWRGISHPAEAVADWERAARPKLGQQGAALARIGAFDLESDAATEEHQEEPFDADADAPPPTLLDRRWSVTLPTPAPEVASEESHDAEQATAPAIEETTSSLLVEDDEESIDNAESRKEAWSESSAVPEWMPGRPPLRAVVGGSSTEPTPTPAVDPDPEPDSESTPEPVRQLHPVGPSASGPDYAGMPTDADAVRHVVSVLGLDAAPGAVVRYLAEHGRTVEARRVRDALYRLRKKEQK